MTENKEPRNLDMGLLFIDEGIGNLRRAVAALRFRSHFSQLLDQGHTGDDTVHLSGGGYWEGLPIDANYHPYTHTKRSEIFRRLNSIGNTSDVALKIRLGSDLVKKAIENRR